MRIPQNARPILAVVVLGLFTGALIAAAGISGGRGMRFPGRAPRHLPRAPESLGLTVWAFRWPAPIGGPEVDLAQVVSVFRASHPGVTVDVTLLSQQAFSERLAAALSSGDPPDVVLPPPGHLALYDQTLQVDFNPFLSRTDLQLYISEALASCTRGGKLLSLPTWVEGRAWVADAVSLRMAGFDPGGTVDGWTWGEFERLCERLKATGVPPIIMDPSSPELMVDLGYEPPASNEQPAPGGAVPVVLSAPPAEMARSLARRGLARIHVVGSAASRAVSAIAAGDAAIAAGISPVLASEILARFSSKAYRPILLPVPTSGVPGGQSLRAGGVAVFRRAAAGGDGRTSLAVDLARAISLAPRHPAAPVLMVPAAKPLLGPWTEAHRWNAVVALASVARGRTGPLPTPAEIDAIARARETARLELRREFGRAR